MRDDLRELLLGAAMGVSAVAATVAMGIAIATEGYLGELVAVVLLGVFLVLARKVWRGDV